MACRGFLQCTLKLSNFILTFVGAGMILYSLWMLNQWHKDEHAPEPSPVPRGDYSALIQSAKSAMETLELPVQTDVSENHHSERLTVFMDSAVKLKSSFFPDELPAPWFIYAFLGGGIIICLVTCMGHIAAETSSGCCLSSYIFFIIILMGVQGGITAGIFFDKNWQKDIPDDPTGELDTITKFVKDNPDICKWLGLSVIIVEGFALLNSLTLRAVADPRKSGYDSDDDYLPRSGPRAPLINRQAPNPSAAAPGTPPAENRPGRSSDEWSKRMREKYGLDTNEFTYNPSESRRFPQQGAPASEEKKSGFCSIM